MIVLDVHSTCDVRSRPMTPTGRMHGCRHSGCVHCRSQTPEVIVEIRFKQMGVPVVLATHGFKCCSMALFANPNLLFDRIVPDMLSLMGSSHDNLMDYYSDNNVVFDIGAWEFWKVFLFSKLFAHAQTAREGRWVGLAVLVEIHVRHTHVRPVIVWVPEQSQREFGGIPASDSARPIRGFGKKIFKGEDVGFSCAICLDEFVLGVELTEMPCSHSFHRDCITTWLKTSNTCPLCRFRILGD